MIRLENISKSYSENITAVNNINLMVETGETLILIGLSGCGKTTTLKMINRLIEPDKGAIYINDEDIKTINPINLRRNIGYVIQDIGLFPHMTIEDNISVVPKLKKWAKEKIEKKILEIMDIVKLPVSFLKRYPHELSGGQQQRVGVARAVISEPDIVLMDEPFGALDPITKEKLQDEFINLKNRIQKTIVFVTHDIFEAFKIADRIAIMDQGKILQSATPLGIAENPANNFVAKFLGKHRKTLLLELKDEV
ncbi:MAG: ATP-binding cassette domain-containing protein [Thermodesulfobacteriota bacterium]|nr:ATP-binding cassette domain-containing protein [Thermodesulfobacteriota bacterium]